MIGSTILATYHFRPHDELEITLSPSKGISSGFWRTLTRKSHLEPVERDFERVLANPDPQKSS